MQSRSRLTAHEAQTGKFLWDYETQCNTISSATTGDGCVYLPSHGLHALRCNPARGKPELLWHDERLRSGNASPIVHEGRTYTIKSPVILVCGNAADGEVLWQLRLKGKQQWATPVLADGLIYVVNYDGQVHVVDLAPELKPEDRLVGTSQIDAKILASPAVADRAIYFRSDQHLWKVVLP